MLLGKKGVLHSQDDHEHNSSSQLDSEGNSQPADFVSLLPSQQIILDIYWHKIKCNVVQCNSKTVC